MTEDRLQLLPEKFLKEIALKEGISIHDNIDKQDLIDLILDAIEEDRAEKIMNNNPAMQIKERKFDITLDEQFDFDEDLYPLPERYNETEIVLLLRDPVWAYTYWDIKDSDISSLKFGDLGGELLLRLYEMRSPVFEKNSIIDFSDIPVTIDDNSWYINLPNTGIYYCVELIMQGSESSKVLCRSNSVQSPQWEIGSFENFQELKGSGNDLMLISSLLDLSESDTTGKIPQRIISMIDSDFLE